MNDTEKNPLLIQTTILGKTQKDASVNTDLNPYLVILSGQEQGKQYRLQQQYNTFGRAADVDIVIADSSISRKHGVLIIYPDCIVLEDYQSTNGCYVDGVRIERQVIALTARIRVGNTLMKIDFKKDSEVELEQALYKAANTDALTRIPNRRAFMSRAQEEFACLKRHQGNLAIIMCDVDHFKRINDQFGHPAGDHVLRELARILLGLMRQEDILARYGGEEFIMLLRSADADSAFKWAERCRYTIENNEFVFRNIKMPITLSIGICCQSSTMMTTLGAAIQKADDALYMAKNNGRNNVKLI